jgi:hypothetical protein
LSLEEEAVLAPNALQADVGTDAHNAKSVAAAGVRAAQPHFHPWL